MNFHHTVIKSVYVAGIGPLYRQDSKSVEQVMAYGAYTLYYDVLTHFGPVRIESECFTRDSPLTLVANWKHRFTELVEEVCQMIEEPFPPPVAELKRIIEESRKNLTVG